MLVTFWAHWLLDITRKRGWELTVSLQGETWGGRYSKESEFMPPLEILRENIGLRAPGSEIREIIDERALLSILRTISAHTHSPGKLQLCALALSRRPFWKGKAQKVWWFPWEDPVVRPYFRHCFWVELLYRPAATAPPCPRPPPSSAALVEALHPARWRWNQISQGDQVHPLHVSSFTS